MTMYDTQTGSLPGRCEDQGSLSERIERRIKNKLCGRIRYLHVVCSGDQILLQGRSRTYHAKQLAQEAALDPTDGPSRLVNEIVVFRPGGGRSRKEGLDPAWVGGRDNEQDLGVRQSLDQERTLRINLLSGRGLQRP